MLREKMRKGLRLDPACATAIFCSVFALSTMLFSLESHTEWLLSVVTSEQKPYDGVSPLPSSQWGALLPRGLCGGGHSEDQS